MSYSIIDASNDFSDLSNDIGKFKLVLCKKLDIDVTSQDYRLVTLDSIQQLLLSLVCYIRPFVRLQEMIGVNEFLKVLNVGILDREELEQKRLIYKFPIEALVTMTHFQIDSLFGNYCELNENEIQGFYRRMTFVFNNIDIQPKEKNDFGHILQCLAFVRNSFHSSGLHRIFRGNWESGIEPLNGVIDKEFEIEEEKIVFKHNEVIVYNWRSIFFLLRESVNVIMEISMKFD